MNIANFYYIKSNFLNNIIFVKITLITFWTLFNIFVTNQRNQIIFNFSKSIFQKRSIIFDDDKIKINKLDIYHEDRNELNDWLTQIDVYFAFNKVSDDKQILFVSIFLRDRAKRWFKSKFRQYLNDDENIDNIFFNYNDFKKKIKRIFEIFNEKQIAKRNIQHFTQRTSATNFAVRFQKQVNLIEWNDVALMSMFRRDFKNNVKNELIRWDEKLKNFNQLIETAMKLNDKLYEKIMKKRYDESNEKADIFTEYFSERRKESRFNNRNHNQEKINYYEFMSMKLNFIQKRKKKKSLRNKQQDNKSKTCYACDKSSHFVKNCFNDKSMLHWK